MADTVFGPVRELFREVAKTIVPEAEALDESSWVEMETILERGLATRPAKIRRQLRLFVRVIHRSPVTLVAGAGLIAGAITLSFAQVAIIWGVLIAGSTPFCAIGLLIGTLTSASAAPAWGNLVFLPMMWLSGLFIPLPAVLERWVLIWPTFHLNQLALGLAGVDQFVYIPPSMAGAALLGLTVLCGGLAIRRLDRIG